MSVIKVEYIVNNEKGFSIDDLTYPHVKSLGDMFIGKLINFSKEINEQNGYIELTVGASESIKDGISYSAQVKGIDDALADKIYLSGVML